MIENLFNCFKKSTVDLFETDELHINFATGYLKKLNVELQGENKVIIEMYA